MPQFRESAGNDDLRAMQGLVQRTWSEGAGWHIGDVAWQRSWLPGAASDWRTALWENGDMVVAWGWVELPNFLNLVVDPAYPRLADEVIAWFARVTDAERLTCSVLETEPHLIAALERAGYAPDLTATWFTHHHMPLDASLAAANAPEGFTLRHMWPNEAERRGAVHRSAFSDTRPSRMTTESYRAVMAAWPYRPDLDWVAVAPDGEMVASALVWLDAVNQVGLLEPVGCAPAYRRHGLARAVNLAALRALREAGATAALVCPRGDDGYPIPGKLYRSLGFQPGARSVMYVRQAR